MNFVIIGEPKGKQRPRFSKGIVYTPKETKDYEKLVASLYKAAKGELIEGELALIVKAYFKIPEKTSKKNTMLMAKGMLRPHKKPDIDNIIKIVMDGLNKVAYEDDSHVVEVMASKSYTEGEPRVEVSIFKL